MGRGSSGAGGYGAPRNVNTSGGASFRTVELVNDAIEAKANDSRSGVRQALEIINVGQKITTYSGEYYQGSAREVRGVANDIVTWEKMDDGTWRGDNGRRIDNSDLARRVYNGGPINKLAPGEISTESRVEVTGRPGREIDGLRYASGVYDIRVAGSRVGADGPRKISETGRITTYNGTQYGIKKTSAGDYQITHIPTGLSVGAQNVRTLADASDFIKAVDKRISANGDIRVEADRFRRMIRGD